MKLNYIAVEVLETTIEKTFNSYLINYTFINKSILEKLKINIILKNNNYNYDSKTI